MKTFKPENCHVSGDRLRWVTSERVRQSTICATLVGDGYESAGGYLLGTTADPAADQAITYGFDSVGRFETVNDGTRTFTYTREGNSDLIGGYVLRSKFSS